MPNRFDQVVHERDTRGKPAVCAVAGGVIVESTRSNTPPAPEPARSSLLSWITDFFRRDTVDSHPIDRATD